LQINPPHTGDWYRAVCNNLEDGQFHLGCLSVCWLHEENCVWIITSKATGRKRYKPFQHLSLQIGLT